MSMSSSRPAPLAGVRVIESSMLGPAGITTHLADLGADVIKVEPPAGDYIRQMTWPIVEGVSLMHLHLNRGKKSVVLNLKERRDHEILLSMADTADVIVESWRPGVADRPGIGADTYRFDDQIDGV